MIIAAWTRAGLAGASFGFLALMVATGALTGMDGTKAHSFSWLVETLFVGSLGRTGAVAALVILGAIAALIAFRWQGRRWDGDAVNAAMPESTFTSLRVVLPSQTRTSIRSA